MHRSTDYEKRWNKAFLLNLVVIAGWAPSAYFLGLYNPVLGIAYVIPSAVVIYIAKLWWWKKILGEFFRKDE